MRFFLLFLCLLISSNTRAELFVDYVEYGDTVYSKSKRTELGDEIDLGMGLKYRYNDETYAHLGFQTYPEDNREVNKTGKFEISVHHQLNQVDLALDLELLTDDGTSGGTNLGFDLDSDDTYIDWKITDSMGLAFYPFNFDGEVGSGFSTWDVTRIHMIEGTQPGGTINGTQGSQKIVTKTIPGLVFKFNLDQWNLYAGFGMASYVYPVDTDFDITNNSSVTRLERKEDIGYKLGVAFKGDKAEYRLKYVGHSQAKETGALLEAAGSLYFIKQVLALIIETELTYAKASEAPWEIDRSSGWYKQTAPYSPIYSNYLGTSIQDWVGKSDVAFSFKIGYEMEGMTPYVFYRRLGKNFIFNDGDSAHELRTYDLNSSHGGLSRIGVGSYFRYGKNLVINPEFEFKSAENPVFANSSDVREDKFLGTFKKNDFQIGLSVTYEYGGNSEFKL